MENRMRWLESLVRANCPSIDLAGEPENERRRTDDNKQASGPNNHTEFDFDFAQSPPPEPRTPVAQENASSR